MRESDEDRMEEEFRKLERELDRPVWYHIFMGALGSVITTVWALIPIALLCLVAVWLYGIFF